ncbi:MAG: hypothetical protein ABI134_20795 [Byssovorax sp.]
MLAKSSRGASKSGAMWTCPAALPKRGCDRAAFGGATGTSWTA